MAYEKQTWECGDTITAEKLNHMEDGIEGASNVSGSVRTVTKSIEVTAQSHERRPFEVSFSELQGKTFLGILGVFPQNMDLDVVIFNGDYDTDGFIVMAQVYNSTSATITTNVSITVTYLDE